MSEIFGPRIAYGELVEVGLTRGGQGLYIASMADDLRAAGDMLYRRVAVLQVGDLEALAMKAAEAAGLELELAEARRQVDTMLASFDEVEADRNRIATERDMLRADLEAAAGDLPVPMPEPGSDMARLLVANKLLATRAREAEEQLDAARVRLVTAEHAVGEAWFSGGADLDEAISRKCTWLERQAGAGLLVPPLDDDLRAILGRPNFTCVHIAQVLRIGGMEIASKAEAEQAAVLHWLLTKYAEHGAIWRAKAEEELAAIRANATPAPEKARDP